MAGQHDRCENTDPGGGSTARAAILESLEQQLKRGEKSLVGNKGYRRYLKALSGGFAIDEKKVAEEARYDGKWVLQTSTELAAEEVALRYKQLWMIEEMMRAVKSVLETRPIYHRRDETIRRHVFCSFLALILRQQLEWDDILRDLELLEEIEVGQSERRFLLRTEARGVTGRVFQAVGVALPPTVRAVERSP